jgi:hypothetical protein
LFSGVRRASEGDWRGCITQMMLDPPGVLTPHGVVAVTVRNQSTCTLPGAAANGWDVFADSPFLGLFGLDHPSGASRLSTDSGSRWCGFSGLGGSIFFQKLFSTGGRGQKACILDFPTNQKPTPNRWFLDPKKRLLRMPKRALRLFYSRSVAASGAGQWRGSLCSICAHPWFRWVAIMYI